ncbi:MAG: STAS domain-containing protein [Fibromonadaceae bacterium]|jgi:anti-sigma B factor antagonist|nr:STAS domain-containing protein [Fibromonadaceae bacterium]
MKKDEFEITENTENNTAVFILKGRLNVGSADWLQFKLEEALKDGQKNILLNMSQVEFLSSSGIRVILKIYKQLTEKGGKFGIERPSECVKNVLGMAALKEMLVT